MQPKLVITSHIPLEIGEVYRGLRRGPDGEPRLNQAFRVLRTSTREAWVNCVVSFGADSEWAELISWVDDYFYEIETD